MKIDIITVTIVGDHGMPEPHTYTNRKAAEGFFLEMARARGYAEEDTSIEAIYDWQSQPGFCKDDLIGWAESSVSNSISNFNWSAAKYIDASNLFISFGADWLFADFYASDGISFSFGDANRTLVTLNSFLDEVERLLGDEDGTADFIRAVKEDPNFDPLAYVDLEN